MKRIDAHTHVYSNDDARYPSIEAPTRPPGRSGTFTSLKKLADENGISRVCALQPSSFYGWDNRFVCDLALSEPESVAAICTLNPEDQSSPSQVGRLKNKYGIRGIRSIPASDGRIDHPGVRDLWRACADHDLTVNVLIKYDKADQLASLLREFGEVRCVIDHSLMLAAGPAEEKALAAMVALAQHANAFAKVSFLPTNSTEGYPFHDQHDACRRVIEAYTPKRSVWGSNFPCELWTPNSTYRQNLDVFTSGLGLDMQAQEDIFWNTSSRLWFQGR